MQQIQASRGALSGAFAAILADGSVVTWGSAPDGGDSRAVQDQLKNVRRIQAAARAFAAVVSNRSVVAWGHAHFGGSTVAVQDQLKTVQQIQVSDGAFAASFGTDLSLPGVMLALVLTVVLCRTS